VLDDYLEMSWGSGWTVAYKEVCEDPLSKAEPPPVFPVRPELSYVYASSKATNVLPELASTRAYPFMEKRWKIVAGSLNHHCNVKMDLRFLLRTKRLEETLLFVFLDENRYHQHWEYDYYDNDAYDGSGWWYIVRIPPVKVVLLV
jgi:hypothetical protein